MPLGTWDSNSLVELLTEGLLFVGLCASTRDAWAAGLAKSLPVHRFILVSERHSVGGKAEGSRRRAGGFELSFLLEMRF